MGQLDADGILGFSPSDQGTGAKLIVPALYQKGLIEKNMFSLHFNYNNTHILTLGGYDLSFKLQWFPLSSKNYWQIKLSSLKIGGKPT